MKDPIRVLYVAQEFTPFLPETIMAQVSREFPQYAQEQGYQIRLFVPCYGQINERKHQLHEVQRLSGMNLIIDDNDHQLIIKVATLSSARLQVYFIDNEEYFKRKGIYADEEGVEYADNHERQIFFTRGVLETIKKLRWAPDIVHCNGWFTALCPFYIRTAYKDLPFFKRSKLVYTVFGQNFQSTYPDSFAKSIISTGVEPDDVKEFENEKIGYDRLVRLAIDYSDAVILGSEEVKPEICDYINEKDKPCVALSGEMKDDYLAFITDLLPESRIVDDD